MKQIAVLVLFISTALAAVSIIAQPKFNQSNSYVITESNLPLAAETHEIVQLSNIVLISQPREGVLVKARIENVRICDQRGFQIGGNNSGVHGLAVSSYYPGKVWVTLEFLNKILLIDPGLHSVDAVPRIIMLINIPTMANGPHYVSEYGTDLWITLKASHHVLRISHRNPSQYSLYVGVSNPIFVARHPQNNKFYSSQDQSSKILEIDPSNNVVQLISIPVTAGSTPVGLIGGPSDVWFVLLGNGTTGTGTFGRINADSSLDFFKLNSSLGQNSSLLHLAFSVEAARDHILWLLASSIVKADAINMLLRVEFDASWSVIVNEEAFVFPTQRSKAHRVLPVNTNSIYATELASSKLLSLSLNRCDCHK
jgi:hypothetical protein